ncbi:MAG: DUF4279 domain-containing protein [Pseudomonadota bacterium]
MPQLSKSQATLRLIGDDLDPREVTERLGYSPSSHKTKGEILIAKRTGRERVARTGSWHLTSVTREPADLNGQVREILGPLSDDMAVWENFADRYKIDLFASFFLGLGNEGYAVSPSTLRMLGERGIQLSLDIYGPDEE